MLPPKANAGFVAAMEDVLDVYARPYDPRRPQVCMDEGGKQLIGEARPPLPVRPKSPAKEDHEYVRNGTANLFLAFEPLAGWRHVEVTERRTSADFGRFIRLLVDEQYPDAEKVVLVLDNLSTHTAAALYETFAPEEARRILRRLEFNYTPTHASWLNMVEIEIGVLRSQCLDRRIASRSRLQTEIKAWECKRNQTGARIQWMFTAEKARTKMARAYPTPGKES